MDSRFHQAEEGVQGALWFRKTDLYQLDPVVRVLEAVAMAGEQLLVVEAE